jgi:hypothetical protein
MSVDEETERPGIPGIIVAQPGTYLLAEPLIEFLSDVAESLLVMPERLAEAVTDARAALLAAVDGFAEVLVPVVSDEQEKRAVTSSPSETLISSEKLAKLSEAARVEVYPNEDGSYWYARAVDPVGFIISPPVGQISHQGVLEDAARIWPGVDVYEIPDEMADSIWAESNPASTWQGRQRPSPRRMFRQ